MAFRKMLTPTTVNIVVLGAPMMGKTAFIKRFLHDGKVQLVHFVEVSGRKEMYAERDKRISRADALLVMYAVNDKKSLKKAVKICRHVCDVKESDEIPLILIGNKTDLKEDKGLKLKKILCKLNCLHMEASARLNTNVGPIFDRILKLAHAKSLPNYNSTGQRSLQQSAYCDHMPPRRFSKFAIKDLHREDAIRKQKQEKSMSRTSKTSDDFAKFESSRPSRNSNGMTDITQPGPNSLIHHNHEQNNRENRRKSVK